MTNNKNEWMTSMKTRDRKDFKQRETLIMQYF